MNSFETDMKRAVCSKGFVTGLALELAILLQAGFDSDLFRMSVPVIAALPYSTAWLMDYQSGYIKSYLPRTSTAAYILGKFFSCGISGGLAQTLGCLIFMLIKEDAEINLMLIFTSGMFWAVAAAVLAAWSNSRYIAYGGGFVLYYMLVILYHRYFEHMYCLYPYEWLAPSHTWILGEQGVMLMLSGMMLVLSCIFYEIVRRRMERV